MIPTTGAQWTSSMTKTTGPPHRRPSSRHTGQLSLSNTGPPGQDINRLCTMGDQLPCNQDLTFHDMGLQMYGNLAGLSTIVRDGGLYLRGIHYVDPTDTLDKRHDAYETRTHQVTYRSRCQGMESTVPLGLEPLAGPVVYAALSGWIASRKDMSVPRLVLPPTFLFMEGATPDVYVYWSLHFDRQWGLARIPACFADLVVPVPTHWGAQDARKLVQSTSRAAQTRDIYLRSLGIGLPDVLLHPMGVYNPRRAADYDGHGPYVPPAACVAGVPPVFTPTNDDPVANYYPAVCVDRFPLYWYNILWAIPAGETNTDWFGDVKPDPAPTNVLHGVRVTPESFDPTLNGMPQYIDVPGMAGNPLACISTGACPDPLRLNPRIRCFVHVCGIPQQLSRLRSGIPEFAAWSRLNPRIRCFVHVHGVPQ